jgi:hypothetical protein
MCRIAVRPLLLDVNTPGRQPVLGVGERAPMRKAGCGRSAEARRDNAERVGDTVAILCAQQRLRTILRLALQADDHEVLEWDHRREPADLTVATVVIDLDSLYQDVPGVLRLLGHWGVDEAAALLFIAVYPLDLRSIGWVGPCDALQPPFSPLVLADRVRRLRAL